MTHIEKHFRKLSTAYEKLEEKRKSLSQPDYDEYYARLKMMYKTFIENHNVFTLSKNDIERLLRIQWDHDPLNHDQFLYTILNPSKPRPNEKSVNAYRSPIRRLLDSRK